MMDENLPTSPGKWTLEVKDPDGQLVSRSEGPMHSYVANFLRVIRIMIRDTTQTVTLMTGVGNPSSAIQRNFSNIRGPVGSIDSGILIGTSPRAVVGTDFKLGSRYQHGGTTANRFTYNKGTIVYPRGSFTAGSSSFRYQRTFTNSTVAAMTVNEIGIAGLIDPGFPMLIIRDVVTPTVVNPSTTLTVTYDLFTVA